MMAMLRDEKDTIQAKQEGDSMAQTAFASSSLTIGTSRRWSGFKNPRIVRVSRTFGGKDRHSKVCTIRGLRDRRIRLSVPTAVQLYDLQEKLGLSQPSKVIDWLLDATKVDIDELPPLHFPQFHDQHAPIGHVSNNNYPPPNHFAPYLDANLTLMNAQPPQVGSSSMMTSRKEGININDHFDGENRNEDEDDSHRLVGARLENQYLGGGAFLPSLMNSSTLPPAYGNFYHWNPSNLSLSQFGSHGFSANSEEGYQGGNSSTQQLLFCPPPSTAPLFPHSDTSAAMSAEFQPRGSGLKPLAPHQPQYKPSD